MKYQVTVGNIGTVYDGTNKREAEEAFQEYMEQSRSGPGWARVSCEDVALWENGEPIREFVYPGDIEEPLQSVKSGDEELAAKARLIAAAPDLLEALEYVLFNCKATGMSEFQLRDARAAIAKAKGE